MTIRLLFYFFSGSHILEKRVLVLAKYLLPINPKVRLIEKVSLSRHSLLIFQLSLPHHEIICSHPTFSEQETAYYIVPFFYTDFHSGSHCCVLLKTDPVHIGYLIRHHPHFSSHSCSYRICSFVFVRASPSSDKDAIKASPVYTFSFYGF